MSIYNRLMIRKTFKVVYDIDDNIILPSTWNEKTWNGLTNLFGSNIWTDGENIYYSNYSTQKVLNKATSTWSDKTWYGLTSFNAEDIWTDGTNIYYSTLVYSYVLDKQTSTWSNKTWNGLTNFYGQYIWTDGVNIYYSYLSTQKVLNKATSTWSDKTWSGLPSQCYGSYFWSDGDNVYYSENSDKQYVLNKSTNKWSIKTWNKSIVGTLIWSDGYKIYYSNLLNQYVLNKETGFWENKMNKGLTNFLGSNIWTDGDNIYYSNGSSGTGTSGNYILTSNKPTIAYENEPLLIEYTFANNYQLSSRNVVGDVTYSYPSDESILITPSSSLNTSDTITISIESETSLSQTVNITYRDAYSGEGKRNSFSGWVNAPTTATKGETFVVSYDGIAELQNAGYNLLYIRSENGTLITSTSSSSDIISKNYGSTDWRISYNITLPLDFQYDTIIIEALSYENASSNPCLVKGTKVRTFEGDKNVEDITYNDLLLIYDVYRGKLCYQHPTFIRNKSYKDQYLKITFENGEILKITRSHEFLDIKNHIVFNISILNYNKLDYNNIELMYCDNSNNIYPIKIANVELVNEVVEDYEVLTSGTMCYFAGNVLNAQVYLNFMGDFKENNTIDTTLMDYIDNNISFTYKDFCKVFGNIREELYNSCLLKYIGAGLETDIYKEVEKYINAFLSDEVQNPLHETAPKLIEEAVSNFFSIAIPYDNDVCKLTFLYKDGKISYLDGKLNDIIEIPHGDWYCVGDRKTYKNNIKVTMNTTFEEK